MFNRSVIYIKYYSFLCPFYSLSHKDSISLSSLTENHVFDFWCRSWDSNPHAVRHGNLNPACLPVPSDRHIALKVGQTPHFVDYWNFLVFPIHASFVDRSPITGIALTLVQAHGDSMWGDIVRSARARWTTPESILPGFFYMVR